MEVGANDALNDVRACHILADCEGARQPGLSEAKSGGSSRHGPLPTEFVGRVRDCLHSSFRCYVQSASCRRIGAAMFGRTTAASASRSADPGFRFHLRALRFGGLKPPEARSASVGGSFNPGYAC
jgi:hypothetical protein